MAGSISASSPPPVSRHGAAAVPTGTLGGTCASAPGHVGASRPTRRTHHTSSGGPCDWEAGAEAKGFGPIVAQRAVVLRPAPGVDLTAAATAPSAVIEPGGGDGPREGLADGTSPGPGVTLGGGPIVGGGGLPQAAGIARPITRRTGLASRVAEALRTRGPVGPGRRLVH